MILTPQQLNIVLDIFDCGEATLNGANDALEKYGVARLPWFKVNKHLHPVTKAPSYIVVFELKYSDMAAKLTEHMAQNNGEIVNLDEWRKRYFDSFAWYMDRMPQQKLTLDDMRKREARNAGALKRALKRDENKKKLQVEYTFAHAMNPDETFEVLSDWLEETRGLPEISHHAHMILDRISDRGMTKKQTIAELVGGSMTPNEFGIAWRELIARGNVGVEIN